MSRFPTFSEGRVVAHDVPNRRLIVDIPSTQMVGIGVKMLIHGPADAVRVTHTAMPGRGTWGLIAFPNGGDPISGIWLGSFYGSLLTALTATEDPFVEYNAHFSGAYEFMDGKGRWTKSFPDGTFIQVSDTLDKPALSRQTVDPQQNQQQTAFTDQQRVATPPGAAFTLQIKHASGATVTIDPQGKVTLTAPGDIKITTKTTLTIETPTTIMNTDLLVTGKVIAGYGGARQVGLQTHTHNHGAPPDGGT